MRTTIARFLFCFALYFGVLIVPWPGWNAFYGDYFRAIGRAVFPEGSGRWIIRFEAARGLRPPLETAITVANREQVRADGRGPAKTLGLDTRSVGWVPTALTLALILASPVPWKRRGRALLWGLTLVHIFIFLSVGCYIWNESASLGLANIPAFWKPVADGLEETLVTQLGASFVMPALIWLVVTFRTKGSSEWIIFSDIRQVMGADGSAGVARAESHWKN